MRLIAEKIHHLILSYLGRGALSEMMISPDRMNVFRPESFGGSMSPISGIQPNDLAKEFHSRSTIFDKRSTVPDNSPAAKYTKRKNTEVKSRDLSSGDLLANKRRKRHDEHLPPGINKNDLDFYGFACTCAQNYKGQKCDGKNFKGYCY